MAYPNKPIGFGLNIPRYDSDLQRIAAERMFADGLIGPNVGVQSQEQANTPQPPALPAMAPYTIPNINLPQFNAPEAPVYTPYSETEQGKKLIEELSKKRQEAEARQQEQINQAQIQLQDYLSKQKAMDLLPLAALTDTWTGSNMARYFKDEQDKNREIALELQKDLLKYGQQGITNEAEYIKDRLGAGTDEAKIGAVLAQNKYEADLKARQALYDTNLDTAAKLAIADEARKANKALEEFKAKNKLELEKIKAGKKNSTEARQERQFKLSVAEKVGSNKLFQAGPNRLKMLDILDKYENAVKDLDERRLAVGPTLDPKLQERKTEIGRIYGAYTSLQKEVDELGALTGSDIGIIWSQMPNATDWWYAGKSAMSGGGKKGILDAIRKTKEKLLQDHDIGIQQLKDTYQDVPEAMDAIDRQNKTVRSKLEKSFKLGTQPPEVTEVKQNTPPAGFQPTGRRR